MKTKPRIVARKTPAISPEIFNYAGVLIQRAWIDNSILVSNILPIESLSQNDLRSHEQKLKFLKRHPC